MDILKLIQTVNLKKRIYIFQEEVRALFASIGEIESCKLVRDKMSGKYLNLLFI